MVSKHTFKKTRHNLYEKQNFSNIYILIILIIAEILCLYYCIVAIFAHKPFVFSSFQYWPLIIGTLLGPTLLLICYYTIRLDTIYNDDGIFYRWFPMNKRYKMIQWDAIREIALVDLKSTKVGFRFSKKFDRVDHIGGNIGLYITMKNSKKRLIGTHKTEALNRVLIRLAGNMYTPSAIVESHDYKDE